MYTAGERGGFKMEHGNKVPMTRERTSLANIPLQSSIEEGAGVDERVVPKRNSPGAACRRISRQREDTLKNLFLGS
jgi:hypothetical protein